MKSKILNKINYGSLVKSSRDLVTNKNFRNNQNYIISNFSKFKFSRKYYRSWFFNKSWDILRYIFNTTIIFLMITVIFMENFNYIVIKEIIIYGIFLLLGTFVLILFFILFDRGIYYFYKKINFIRKKHIFTSNRYIFFKNPKKQGSMLNRRDFISFKK